MCHLCFTIERTLVYGAFCVLLSCCRPRRSSRNGKQVGKRPPPPSPLCDTFKSLPPPPLDNSMLGVTFSLYLCPFGAYLFFVVIVSLDTKGNECIS